MNLKTQRAALIKEAQEIAAKASDLDQDGIDRLEAIEAEVKSITAKIDQASDSDALMKRLGEVAGPEGAGDREAATPAKSLGEHFVKSVGNEGLQRVKTITGAVVAAPEFKAATDTQSTPASLAPWLTDYDRTIVRAFRRPVVSDLLGPGSLSGNAVTYLVEGSVEGGSGRPNGFGTVAEAGSKPQFHMGDPTTKTDALKKIAGFLKFTDEMVEDAPFWISEINNRGLYLLALTEEDQLLNGSGAGNNVLGLLNRGIGTLSAVDNTDNADALFRAITKVQVDSGLSPDGIVINPADYQDLRLGKDGNGQYMGGGYFQGQYGNGSMDEQPPLWGLRTIVSPAVAAGTAVVGAFGTAATVYRKGGVRVESTNSHDSDFTSNLITTRIEERIALAVRVPSAFVEVTLSDDEPGGGE